MRLAFLAILALLLPASAEINAQVAPVAAFGGTSQAVAFHTVGGQRLLLQGRGGTLLIHGTEDPSRPVLLGSLVLHREILSVRAEGGLAAIAHTWSLVSIVDISDPVRPRLLSSPPSVRLAQAACISGGRLYVAAGKDGLQILDLADARNPALLGAYGAKAEAYSGVTDVQVRGTLAYVAMGDSLFVIVDVSDPRNPVKRGGLTVPFVRFVTLQGDRAYLGATYSGLKIVDVTRPEAPALLPYSDLTYTYQVAISGTTACMAGFPGRIMDMSSPDRPTARLEYRDGEQSWGAAIDGSLCALASRESGVVLLDAAGSPGSPPLAILPTQAPATKVVAGGRLAFLGGGPSSQEPYEFSDPSHPVPVATFDSGVMLVKDGFAYATGGKSSRYGKAWDVRDPSKPVITVDSLGWGEVEDIQGKGNLLAAASPDSITLFDLSDPSRPVRSGRTRRGSREHLPALGPGFLATVWRDSLVVLTDISDPSDPFHRDTLYIPGGIANLWIEGRSLYIGGSSRILRYALDASLHPTLTLQKAVPITLIPYFPFPPWEQPSSLWRIATFGRFLVAGTSDGLFATDTSDSRENGPWNRFLGLNTATSDIQVAGGLMYVAATGSGFFVFDPFLVSGAVARKGRRPDLPVRMWRQGTWHFGRGSDAADPLGRIRSGRQPAR